MSQRWSKNKISSLRIFTVFIHVIGYSENKNIPQYLLLVIEGQTTVLVPRPPVESKQQQTGSSGEFLSFRFDTTHTLIQTRRLQRADFAEHCAMQLPS